LESIEVLITELKKPIYESSFFKHGRFVEEVAPIDLEIDNGLDLIPSSNTSSKSFFLSIHICMKLLNTEVNDLFDYDFVLEEQNDALEDIGCNETDLFSF
jgi:hypothetical protein